MPSKRSNIVTRLVLFIILFYLFAYFNPIGREPNQIIGFIYVIVAMIITDGIYYCYAKARIRKFSEKLNEYCNQKIYDEAINMLDKAIHNQPKVAWIRMQRAIILALSGKFDSFWAEFNKIYNKEPFRKNNDLFYFSVVSIGDTLQFINDTSAAMKLSQIEDIESDEKYNGQPLMYVHKAIQAYQNDEMESAVSYVELLCDENTKLLCAGNSDFYKLFSHFTLMKAYENLGEMDKSDTYRKLYMSNPLNSK